jgi:chondroitin 4-sulfotransferase 11
MISVIVPAYNAETSLDGCLAAIQESIFRDFEVIVVDDGSKDATVIIAEQYPCRLIRLEKNKGLSHARNTGVRYARNEILVFIDADVVVEKDTLSIIHHFFETHPEAAAVVGILNQKCPYHNFFSQYKNLYMNFIFRKISHSITFLYGSIHAVRKIDFLPYDESLAYAEDTELGQRLTKAGKKIFLAKNLKVTHLKAHSFLSLLKNDFRIPFYWVHLFFKYSNPAGLLKKKRFAHARASQISSIVTASSILWVTVLCALFHQVVLPVLGCLLLLFAALNADFFSFLSQIKGTRFAARAFLFTLLDQIVMASGITAGTIHHFWVERKQSPPKNRVGILKKLNYWSESQRVDTGFRSRLVLSIKDSIYFPVHYLCAVKPFREIFFHFFGTLGCYTPANRAIVSPRHRFIYFYIPKVASSSLKRNLSKNLFQMDTGKRVHFMFFDEVIDVKRGDYQHFFKFAFVRNPWDRVVSCYADKILHADVTDYMYQNGVFRRYAREYKNMFHMGMPFEAFVKAICQIPDPQADRHFKSQHYFISDIDGRVLVDFIGKFETLSADYAYIARKCGLADFTLPHENSSRREKDYRRLYTPETRRLIAERYREDIGRFGYRF